MQKAIKLAILGTRVKPEKFGRIINEQPDCEVAAVWDPSPERSANVAETLGCRAEADVEDIFKDSEIDGVLIVAENCLHAELAVKAAEHGKHVFVEKPLCMNLDEAYRIRDAVNASGVRFFMSDPFVDATTMCAKELMDSGAVGCVKHARVHNFVCFEQYGGGDYSKRAASHGGGVMSDTGCHVLHTVNYLFGLPESLYASFSYENEAAEKWGCEDTAYIIMKYPGELTVLCECSERAPAFADGLEITGFNGVIKAVRGNEGQGGTVYYITEETRSDAEDAGWRTLSGGDLPEGPDRHVIYWLRMIRENIQDEDFENDPKGNSGQSINKAVELMEMQDAIYRSAEKRAAVSLTQP